MNPKVSKELKKATEDLQAKMLEMQTEEAKMLKLKTAFELIVRFGPHN